MGWDRQTTAFRISPADSCGPTDTGPRPLLSGSRQLRVTSRRGPRHPAPRAGMDFQDRCPQAIGGGGGWIFPPHGWCAAQLRLSHPLICSQCKFFGNRLHLPSPKPGVYTGARRLQDGRLVSFPLSRPAGGLDFTPRTRAFPGRHLAQQTLSFRRAFGHGSFLIEHTVPLFYDYKIIYTDPNIIKQ